MADEELHRAVRAAGLARLEYVNQHREQLVEAWVAATGISPLEACLVQQEKNGELRVWVEARTDRCLTHRSEIESLKADVERYRSAGVELRRAVAKYLAEDLDE